jgi:hypothetical protein
MENIRKGVFETNSSSSHSISITMGDKGMFDTIKPDSKGKIVLRGGNWTDPDFICETSIDKANLVATYITACGDDKLRERFEALIKEHTGAKEIVYRIRMFYQNGRPATSFFSPNILSAFSYTYDEEADEEKELSFEDILSDDAILKQFIFGKGSSLTAEYSYN